jgi:hypothetical protein
MNDQTRIGWRIRSVDVSPKRKVAILSKGPGLSGSPHGCHTDSNTLLLLLLLWLTCPDVGSSWTTISLVGLSDELAEDTIDGSTYTWLMERAEICRHDASSSPRFPHTASRVRSDGRVECSGCKRDGR